MWYGCTENLKILATAYRWRKSKKVYILYWTLPLSPHGLNKYNYVFAKAKCNVGSAVHFTPMV